MFLDEFRCLFVTVFLSGMAQTFFVNAHYEYDKNDPEQMTLKEQHAEIFGKNETDPRSVFN